MLTDREKAICWINNLCRSMVQVGKIPDAKSLLEGSKNFLRVVLPNFSEDQLVLLFQEMDETMREDMPKYKILHDQELMKLQDKMPRN